MDGDFCHYCKASIYCETIPAKNGNRYQIKCSNPSCKAMWPMRFSVEDAYVAWIYSGRAIRHFNSLPKRSEREWAMLEFDKKYGELLHKLVVAVIAIGIVVILYLMVSARMSWDEKIARCQGVGLEYNSRLDACIQVLRPWEEQP